MATAGPGPSSQKSPIKTKKEQREKQKRNFAHKQRRGAAEDKSIQGLEAALKDFDPKSNFTSFDELPLSTQTKKGLRKAFFSTPTDIQSQSLPKCLTGQDIHATARTGSGKTLCFLIPILEVLYRRKWGPQDGLGAVVISPTRELAVQTFEVLRSIGGYHTFSAGLVIGGKNLKDESTRVGKMNILIATPGRLLQHLDQAVGFESSDLQVLVLDEADRILDLGFSRTLNAILSHLPPAKSRQTLLFSATSSETVSSLARLSLNDPISISASSDSSSNPTPSNLSQHYTLTPLDKKVDMLWSFIKTHLKNKVIVFMSTTKQVRFLFRVFAGMQPGIQLLHLHGHQSQTARLSVFDKFSKVSSAVLLCTDIASRGLDFPSVDWVLQLDAPEDVDAYIHRVGRTARYTKGGNALLVLCPSEVAFVERLSKRGVEVEEIKVSGKKMLDVRKDMQRAALADVEVKYLAQTAFMSYAKSVHVMADKDVFKLSELPLEKFAESLGLAGMPKVKFLSQEEKEKKAKLAKASEKETGATPATDKDKDKSEVRTRYDRMFGRTNQNILSEHYGKLIDNTAADSDANSEPGSESGDNLAADSDDDFITLARADHDLTALTEPILELAKVKGKTKVQAQNQIPGLPASAVAVASSGSDRNFDPDAHLSKRKLKLGTSKKAMLKFKGQSSKLVFDDEGGAHEIYEAEEVGEGKLGEEWKEKGKEYVEGLKEQRKEEDARDRQEAREKRREKKRARKEREKEVREGGGRNAVLAPPQAGDEDDGYVSPVFDLPPASDEDEDGGAEVKERRPHKKRRKHQRQSSADEDDAMAEDADELERMALAALHR